MLPDERFKASIVPYYALGSWSIKLGCYWLGCQWFFFKSTFLFRCVCLITLPVMSGLLYLSPLSQYLFASFSLSLSASDDPLSNNFFIIKSGHRNFKILICCFFLSSISTELLFRVFQSNLVEHTCLIPDHCSSRNLKQCSHRKAHGS